MSLAGEGGHRNSYGWLPSHIEEGANVFVQSSRWEENNRLTKVPIAIAAVFLKAL